MEYFEKYERAMYPVKDDIYCYEIGYKFEVTLPIDVRGDNHPVIEVRQEKEVMRGSKNMYRIVVELKPYGAYKQPSIIIFTPWLETALNYRLVSKIAIDMIHLNENCGIIQTSSDVDRWVENNELTLAFVLNVCNYDEKLKYKFSNSIEYI